MEDLLPYHPRKEDEERFMYLRLRDVCLLLDEDKDEAAFHGPPAAFYLCVICKIFYSKGGGVRTVTVGYRPKTLRTTNLCPWR